MIRYEAYFVFDFKFLENSKTLLKGMCGDDLVSFPFLISLQGERTLVIFHYPHITNKQTNSQTNKTDVSRLKWF